MSKLYIKKENIIKEPTVGNLKELLERGEYIICGNLKDKENLESLVLEKVCMKSRRTSIRNLTKVLVFNYVAQIVKAEYQYKAHILNETKPIETNIMLKSIQSLNENAIFSDFVDWSYEKVSDTSNMEIYMIQRLEL